MYVFLGLQITVLIVWTVFFYRKHLTVRRLLMLAAVLFVHTFAATYYFYWSKTAITDASGYYYDVFHVGNLPFQVGTQFVYTICYYLKNHFHATYFQTFMAFQLVGYAGFVILFRVFADIEDKLLVASHGPGLLGILLLPSANFWTSMIGKDAPLFFAVSLCVWSMLSLGRRFVYFCIALGVMVLFRAHIALIAVTALALAAFFDTSLATGRKIALLLVAIAGVFLVAGPVEQSIGLDVSSVDSVTQFLDKQNAVYATVGGTTAMGGAPLWLSVLSLLFRPFFFDAPGAMGIVASFENLAFILSLFYIYKNWADFILLLKRVFFFRFVFIYAVVLLFSLSLVYYNVGLGLRERVMAYPMYFSILAAMWAMQQRRVTDRLRASQLEWEAAQNARGVDQRALAAK